MSNIITVESIFNRKSYEFVDSGEPMQGTMKDVYFSPDRSYVVAIYKEEQKFYSKERLKKIVTQYRDSIFNKEGGEYYQNLYCWPSDVVKYGNKIGVIVPTYKKEFFFEKGFASSSDKDSIKGKEKQSKWFTSGRYRNKSYKLRLDDSELGDWKSYFYICIHIARGVKKLHALGLAHSDLSYNNVLVDPKTMKATIIDIDGLVVPGLFAPDVYGTKDFIAPEVLATQHLPKEQRNLPKRTTDLHALAVLIYMYLLHRHPLEGGKFHDESSEKDSLLMMGERALFIEHPTDKSNRPNEIGKYDMPWGDVEKLPCSIAGPHIKEQIYKAFINGLHKPSDRPLAEIWERALIRTLDLLIPCLNRDCQQKWYVFDNSRFPKCPFCGNKYVGLLPVIDLYYPDNYTVPASYKTDGKLVVYNSQRLFHWHTNKYVVRSEKLTGEHRDPVGYFTALQNKIVFVNEKLSSMKDITDPNNKKTVAIGSRVELVNGARFLFSDENGARIAIVSMANI